MDPLELLSPLHRYWFTIGSQAKASRFIRSPKPEDLNEDEWQLLRAMCHLFLAHRCDLRLLDSEQRFYAGTASWMLFLFPISNFKPGKRKLPRGGANATVADETPEGWEAFVERRRPRLVSESKWIQRKAYCHVQLAIWILEGLQTSEKAEVRNRAEGELLYHAGRITHLEIGRYEIELQHPLRSS